MRSVHFINSTFVVPVLFFGFLMHLLPTAWAAETSLNQLIKQPTRPTVQQIESLLRTWNPPELKYEADLPKDQAKPRHDLQYNYPIWYQALIRGAPQMIATFEYAFPGATWAFIGRDMAILADLFEAFYRSLGQSNRVVRIGMSRGTLQDLTEDLAIQLLESHGFELKKGMHPYILVDAVSRGGGRQGRFLMSAVYNAVADKRRWSELDLSPRELLAYFNFIGLRVATTEIPDRPVARALDEIRVDREQNYRNVPVNIDLYSIFTYFDGNVREYFIGINEAGYTHWTGAWHGPFGRVYQREGRTTAKIGPATSEQVHRATVSFQSHVVREAQSGSFLRSVRKEANFLGYFFLINRVKTAKREADLIQAPTEVTEIPSETLSEILSNLHTLTEVEQNQALDLFFSRRPDVGKINQLISTIRTDSHLHYEIAIRALGQLQSRQEYKTLIKPFPEGTSPQAILYQKARREFKHRYPKFSLWKWFSPQS